MYCNYKCDKKQLKKKKNYRHILLFGYIWTNIYHPILHIMLFDTIIMVDTTNIFSFNARSLGNKN